MAYALQDFTPFSLPPPCGQSLRPDSRTGLHRRSLSHGRRRPRHPPRKAARRHEDKGRRLALPFRNRKGKDQNQRQKRTVLHPLPRRRHAPACRKGRRQRLRPHDYRPSIPGSRPPRNHARRKFPPAVPSAATPTTIWTTSPTPPRSMAKAPISSPSQALVRANTASSCSIPIRRTRRTPSSRALALTDAARHQSRPPAGLGKSLYALTTQRDGLETRFAAVRPVFLKISFYLCRKIAPTDGQTAHRWKS